MPLQRHEALRSLSRDHHVALQLARAIQIKGDPRLRAELPADGQQLAAHVQRVFSRELAAHFEVEDSVLAPMVAGQDTTLDRIVSDIESEHAEMMELAAGLAAASTSPEALEQRLDRLGAMLESHVRREEREYYERIQEVLDEAALDHLGEVLQRHLDVKSPSEL